MRIFFMAIVHTFSKGFATQTLFQTCHLQALLYIMYIFLGQLSQKKNGLTFHDAGSLIGILIVAS